MVSQMLAEIQELKEVSLAGYVRGYNNNRGGLIVNMEESEAFKGPLGNSLLFYLCGRHQANVLTISHFMLP